MVKNVFEQHLVQRLEPVAFNGSEVPKHLRQISEGYPREFTKLFAGVDDPKKKLWVAGEDGDFLAFLPVICSKFLLSLFIFVNHLLGKEKSMEEFNSI